MNRNEFLKILRESLDMSLDTNSINDQVEYYDQYISDEIKKGKSEKDVIAELGDPRLIAKTIKIVSGKDEIIDDNDNSQRNSSYHDRNDNSSNYSSNNNSTNRSYNESNNGHSFNYETNTLGCTIAFLIVFIIIMGIFRLFGDLLYGVGALAFSGPIGFLLIAFLFYILFGRGRR